MNLEDGVGKVGELGLRVDKVTCFRRLHGLEQSGVFAFGRDVRYGQLLIGVGKDSMISWKGCG